ncbi:hypothetical protein Dxin01_02675 [Deinococcus xinjiangensis]|uniref:HTH tetR-type domain-containing protein n=1 Tax=Deinococcus xinjiangensis TaxID=457454 RepID=A0ABP9VHU4_9DEIO
MKRLHAHTQRRQANEQNLRLAALQEFARHGLRGARVSHIVSAAGLTQPSFYRLWPSKKAAFDDLLGDVADFIPTMTGRFLTISPDLPFSQMLPLFTAELYEGLLVLPQATILAVNHLLVQPQWRQGAYQQFVDVFQQLQIQGRWDTDLDPSTVVHAYLALVEQWFIRYPHLSPQPAQQVSHLMQRLLFPSLSGAEP